VVASATRYELDDFVWMKFYNRNAVADANYSIQITEKTRILIIDVTYTVSILDGYVSINCKKQQQYKKTIYNTDKKNITSNNYYRNREDWMTSQSIINQRRWLQLVQAILTCWDFAHLTSKYQRG